MADVLDPRDLEKAVMLVEQISRDVERLTEKVTGSATKVRRAVEDTTEDAKEKSIKTFDIIDRKYDDIQRFSIARLHLFGTETEKTLDRLEKKWKEYGAEVKRHLTEARGPLGTAGAATGLTSVMGGAQALKSQMFAGMPFGIGGLLGMALWGAKREEEFNAAARKAMFTLQATGGVAMNQAKGLTGQIRSMYQAWGSMGEEITGTLAAFAEFSVAEEAFNKSSIAAKGFMQNITGVATAVDLMNAAQPGTTARLIGETMTNAGLSVEKASDQVFALAANLREAKLNYGLFASGIVQATSALRVQNQSLGDTTKLFVGLQKRFEEQGMSKQRAAAMALSGVQAATGAIGGLPQGLQGFIAQRLASKGVEGFAGMKDPFALMVKMQEGLSKGGAFASPVFAELKKIAEKAAGTTGTADEKRLRQIGTLQALGVNNFEAARAIIDGKNASEKLLTPAEKSAKFTEDLNKTFSTRAANQSAFERDMRTLQDTLAQIGGDILTVLSSELVLLVEHFKMFPTVMSDMLAEASHGAIGTKMSGQDMQRLVALGQFGSKVTDIQLDAFIAMGPKFERIASTMKDSTSRATVGRSKGLADALTGYERQAGAPPPGEMMTGEAGRKLAQKILHPGPAATDDKMADELEHSATAQEEAAQRLRNAAAIQRLKKGKRRMEAPAGPRRN